MSPNLTGALLMMASMVAFTINDTLIKLTGGEVPLFQLIFLRGVLTSMMIAGLAYGFGMLRFGFGARNWRIIAVRGAAELAATFFFLSALFNMPIGNLTAVLQVLPLTLTLGAWLVFGEPVGWKRMAAIVIGFIGVLLIIRPGTEGFSIWSIYALLAVLSVTVRDLATRRLTKDVPGLAVSFVTAVLITCAAGIGSLSEPWGPVSGGNAVLIVAAAVFILGGYFFSVQVMRVGDVAFVAPFRYTGLIVAMLAGVVIFDEIPTALTLLGAAIVVATGAFTFYRERQVLRTRFAPK